jgi:hypothetical protein
MSSKWDLSSMVGHRAISVRAERRMRGMLGLDMEKDAVEDSGTKRNPPNN